MLNKFGNPINYLFLIIIPTEYRKNSLFYSSYSVYNWFFFFGKDIYIYYIYMQKLITFIFSKCFYLTFSATSLKL
jgi:hypothetical protein